MEEDTLTPLGEIVQKSASEPILDRYHTACQNLLDHLFRNSNDEQNLRHHLSALRAFFFMEAGFAFHHFTRSFFDRIFEGEDWKDVNELNQNLQAALETAGENEYYAKFRSLFYVQIQDETSLPTLPSTPHNMEMDNSR